MKMCGRFCRMAGWPKKSGRGQGGRKAGFHSISDGVPVSINGCNITSLKFHKSPAHKPCGRHGGERRHGLGMETYEISD